MWRRHSRRARGGCLSEPAHSARFGELGEGIPARLFAEVKYTYER